MKVSVFGLGYVGAVSSACLAKEGHEIVGVDPNRNKVDLINDGKAPIIERDLPEIIAEVVESARLRATTSAAEAIGATEASIICVGTPSMPNGSLDLRFIESVCREIGDELKNKPEFHTVIIRSTMLPGSMRETVIPILEESSGKSAGTDFGVCFNPEFLREGAAISDFYNPPKTVIGEIDSESGDYLASLYENISAQLIRTTIENAELLKYIDNVWHALKVGFGNEIGRLCKELELDGQAIMEMFCKDTKLNISSTYLMPGFAFGGSCLPKDLRAITHRARTLDVEIPIINAILQSNQLHIERSIDMVLGQNHKKIGIMGFSFKAGTDDLRESPVVELIERLLGKGCDLKIYDKNVQIAKLVGANRDYIVKHIPHIARLMVETIPEVIDHAEVIVIGNGDPAFANLKDLLKPGQITIDLVGSAHDSSIDLYEGICW